MEGQSLVNLDSLLLQLALQTRELSQKKDDINQHITMTKATIAESKSCIETTKSSVRKLEEDICQKQNVVKHLKANAKSMKTTNSLLHQYEKALQSEIEKREDNCNQDMKAYQERIESYKQVFQKHKVHYCQSPLAKKLLLIQSEKEDIECRIKACDKQISLKQKELDDLYGHTLPIDNSTESVSDGLNTEEPEGQPDGHTEDLHPHVDISSLHLTQPKITQDSHDHFGEVLSEENLEESTGMDAPVYPSSQGHACELWSNPESLEQQRPVEVSSADQDKGSVLQVQVQEEQPILQSVAEEMEEEEEDRRAVDEEQAAFINDEEENEGGSAFSQRSLPSRTCPQSSPARPHPHQTSPSRMKAVSTTPTFSLNSSPSSSPGRRETPGDKSPAAFLFAVNSTPSTPGFSGFNFGFEMGSAQEDSPFAFTSSYFSGKKPLESKSPSGFPFDQSERSEDDFEFSFGGKSPEKTPANPEQGGAHEAFPFSFNFGKF